MLDLSRQGRLAILKIAMVAPLDIRVPPVAYGGTELIVSLLTEELVRRGHGVTLYASGDSLTRAKLVSNTPSFLRKTQGRDARVLTMMNVISCLEKADEFDIIHNHTIFEGMVAARLVKTPMLTTFHNLLVGDEVLLFAEYGGWYNTISRCAKSLLPSKDRFAGVIYNSIDCSTYQFNGDEKEGFLLYLSRLSPEKGAHIAIQVARKLGMPLVISGNIHPKDHEYFLTQVLPYIDGKMVRFEGEAGDERKKALLSSARCTLAPIVWPEPFGLFMVESMACGTPVVAFNNGSAPEVISDRETGYLVRDADAMVEAVRRVDEIDPKACRRHVESNFDYPVMVDNYVRAYTQISSGEVPVKVMNSSGVRSGA